MPSRSEKMQAILVNLYQRHLRKSWHKIKRRVITDTSFEHENWHNVFYKQLYQEGLDQMVHIVKLINQNHKVKAFTFIKMLYTRFKMRRNQTINASKAFQKLIANKIKRRKREAFKEVFSFVLEQKRLNELKFVFKVVDNLLFKALAKIKKDVFERILRCSSQNLNSERAISMDTEPLTQYVCLINNRMRSRKKIREDNSEDSSAFRESLYGIVQYKEQSPQQEYL